MDKKGSEILVRNARAGDAKAQYELGCMYWTGRYFKDVYVHQDKKEGDRLIGLAANQGFDLAKDPLRRQIRYKFGENGDLMMLPQSLVAWLKNLWPQKEIHAGEESRHMVSSTTPKADLVSPNPDLKVLVKDLLEVTSIILKDESLVNKEREKLDAVSSSTEIVDTALKVLQSVRTFLAENQDIHGPAALPAFWWWALSIGRVGGCLVNIYFILHGTSLLVQINPLPNVAFVFLATFTVLILLFSKHVWLDRLGGGAFLFYFFIAIWFVSLLFNLGVSYWVFKVSYRLDIPQNVDPGMGVFMKEALPLAAGMLLTVFPIMLGILLFPDKKRTVLKGQ